MVNRRPDFWRDPHYVYIALIYFYGYDNLWSSVGLTARPGI